MRGGGGGEGGGGREGGQGEGHPLTLPPDTYVALPS